MAGLDGVGDRQGATPRFPGHDQPKVPLWGYRDESDPKEMARSIDALADAGVGAIIFDWYRYDDKINGGMMLEKALRDGFLQAPNRGRIQFALMWANHTYIDCHPFAPGKDFGNAPVWRKGELSRAAFDRHTNDAIRTTSASPTIGRSTANRTFRFTIWTTSSRGLAASRRLARRWTVFATASRRLACPACT